VYFQCHVVFFLEYGIVTVPLEKVGVFVCKGVQPVGSAATAHGYTEFTVLTARVPRLNEIALAAFTTAVYFVATGQGKPHIALFAL